MRRAWLTFLLIFAFTASGVAGAAAMPDCPMQARAATPAAPTGHDCCPDGDRSGDEQPAKQSMDGCFIGMACRPAPAVAPTVMPIRLPSVTMLLSQTIATEPAPPSGPLQELFRPPRTI